MVEVHRERVLLRLVDLLPAEECVLLHRIEGYGDCWNHVLQEITALYSCHGSYYHLVLLSLVFAFDRFFVQIKTPKVLLQESRQRQLCATMVVLYCSLNSICLHSQDC